MNCEQADRLLLDSLMGALDTENRQALDRHLESCDRCRQEATSFESIWHDLGDLDEASHEVPSDRLNRRFRQALAEYEADLQATRRPGFAEWWAGLWAVRPAWQAAFSAALLAVGVFVGGAMSSDETSQGEIEQLRADMDAMSRAVTISLLQHQSASERLRAVSWSRMTSSDDQVLSALLESARQDPNVNVRLAAVDALAGYADSGPVRSGLIESLQGESSPLVQLAVLEAVAGEEGLRDGELRKLTESGVVDESLLQHFAAQAESL